MVSAPELVEKIKESKKELIKQLEVNGKKVQIIVKPIEAIRTIDRYSRKIEMKLTREIVVKVDESEELFMDISKIVAYYNGKLEEFMNSLAEALDEMQNELEQRIPQIEEIAKAIAYLLA